MINNDKSSNGQTGKQARVDGYYCHPDENSKKGNA